jgi:hypothetical protein
MNETQTPHPSWEDLAAFDLGRLPDGDWAKVAEHVAGCERCEAMLNTVPQDAFVSLLRTTVAATPAPAGSETPTQPGGPPAPVAVPAALASHPRYRILEPLGAGGMGVVYKAEHVLMGRVVALKVLRGDVSDRPESVARFCREVKTLAQLSHPNIVTAHDAEEFGGVLFLVMEFVDGESLDRVLARSGPVPPALAAGWVRQVAEGLRFAHERGLVHRDLKPANLLLTPQGQVKISDFGLARISGALAPAPTTTPVGVVVGTPAYVAPEQARDPQTADIRADLYSLGCTWYELLTGRPPFPGGTVLQQLLAHQEQAPTPVTRLRPDVPREVVPVLERLLAKDPARRFQTPAELLAALAPADTQVLPLPHRAAPRWQIAAAVAAVAAACLLLAAGLLAGAGCYWWLTRAARPTPAQHANGGPDDGAAQQPEPSARDQVVAWLNANNSLGPDSDIGESEGRSIDKRAGNGKAFTLRLGPGLVNSGRATVLAGRRNDFFVFPLPPDYPPGERRGAVLTVTADQNHEFLRDAPVTLSDLEVKDALNLDGDRDVTGSVKFKARGRVSAGKQLSLRMTVLLGTVTYSHYHLFKQKELEGDGRLNFRFGPVYSNVMQRTQGPVVVFMELCSINDPASKAKDLVLSNTVAELTMVHDTKAKSKP